MYPNNQVAMGVIWPHHSTPPFFNKPTAPQHPFCEEKLVRRFFPAFSSQERSIATSMVGLLDSPRLAQ